MFESYVVIKGHRYKAVPHPLKESVCSFIRQSGGGGTWSGCEVQLPAYRSPYDHIGSAFGSLNTV